MLKGFAITPPVVGRISIGRVVERNGMRLPEKDDQFTLTSQVQNRDGWLLHPFDDVLRQQAGGKLRNLQVRLLFNDPSLNLRADYNLFDRSTGRPVCVGNGENCRRSGQNGIETLPCPGSDTCRFAEGQCKPYARFNVQIGDEDETGAAGEDDDYEPGEPVQVYTPVWVCTDPQAAGLHYGTRLTNRADDGQPDAASDDEGRAAREAEEDARREAESAERRRVIANNKAWKAAETVRREWLAGFLSRRNVPSGAEALIAKAVIGRMHSLSHAMQHGHSLLPGLLGVKPVEGNVPSYYGNRETCARIIEQATTPKAATVRALAAVLAAWEERSGTHTWRNPGTWDAAIMGALVGWGYPASDVEQLLLQPDEPDEAVSDEPDEAEQG